MLKRWLTTAIAVPVIVGTWAAASNAALTHPVALIALPTLIGVSATAATHAVFTLRRRLTATEATHPNALAPERKLADHTSALTFTVSIVSLLATILLGPLLSLGSADTPGFWAGVTLAVAVLPVIPAMRAILALRVLYVQVVAASWKPDTY